MLFLKIGNMEDILSLPPWEFNEIVEYLGDNPNLWFPDAKIKPRPKHRKLNRSNLDAIEKSKEMKKHGKK